MSKPTNETTDIVSDLNSLDIVKKKTAVKKIISAMTMGRDLSKLFTQVVKNIATTDLELKKLVYLYIINYARVKPLESLLAVNYFKKDASDLSNPLLRALAVRTMGCIGVEQIMQFLCDPLKDALRDKDPYVRKTAVICVAKIYDIQPQLVEDQFEFVDKLQKLIEEEGNSMVLANCLAALNEISISKGYDILKLNWKRCKCLLSALHDNNEWCQIYLLEGISKYQPDNQEEIIEILERVKPCLSHSNSSIVLTAIQILTKLVDIVDSIEVVRDINKRISPALSTLLSDKPEIQYLALKNINLLIMKRPLSFEKDIKLFFCNFSEPIYVKMEKLEVLYKLVSISNVDLVLNELKDYATEVDIQYVRRSVRLIGQCAIKLEKAAVRCVETLVDLVKTQVPFVIQEAVISLRDIFRRYPNTFESAMAIVNENLKSLNDPDSKAAFIWIIGEYADKIEGAEEELSKFIDNLKDEPYVVQLNILTAAMKTFLKCQSDQSFNILDNLFSFASNECDHADIREKGFIYWRLLDMDPEIAKKIVLAEKPRISEDSCTINSNVLDKLIEQLGSLATVYYKLPEQFVRKTKRINEGEDDEFYEDEEEASFNIKEDLNNNKDTKSDNINDVNNKKQENNITDLLDIGDINNINNNINNYEGNNNDNNYNNADEINVTTNLEYNNYDDIIKGSSNNNYENSSIINDSILNSESNIFSNLMGFDTSSNVKKVQVPYAVVVSDQQNGSKNNKSGIKIEASLYRKLDNNLNLKLKFTNSTNDSINNFKIKLNINFLGLSVDVNSLSNIILNPNETQESNIHVTELDQQNINTQKLANERPPYYLEAAIICSLDQFYFSIPVLYCILFVDSMNNIDKDEYLKIWKNKETTNNMCATLNNIHYKFKDSDGIIKRLNDNNINLIHSDQNQGKNRLFFYAMTCNKEKSLICVYLDNNKQEEINLIIKCDTDIIINHVIASIKFMLTKDD